MKKVLDYVLSCIHLLYFAILLLVFHVIQVIAFNIFGAKAHQKSVNILNYFIVKGWLILGTRTYIYRNHPLPEDRSIIFIANHRSMFDIPGIIWFWRKHTPLFVSKKELAKGIPSISYNLRKGKAALIDRKDGKSAVVQIAKLAKHASEHKYSMAIFPEGTRSRSGQLKGFQIGGIAILLKKCPDALVVPIAIKNTGNFNPKGLFPLISFTKITYHSLMPIEPKGLNPEEVVNLARKQIEVSLDE